MPYSIGIVSNDLNQFGTNIGSGRRDSNPPPTAWEAVTLPDELLPLIFNPNSALAKCRIDLRLVINGLKGLLKRFIHRD